MLNWRLVSLTKCWVRFSMTIAGISLLVVFRPLLDFSPRMSNIIFCVSFSMEHMGLVFFYKFLPFDDPLRRKKTKKTNSPAPMLRHSRDNDSSLHWEPKMSRQMLRPLTGRNVCCCSARGLRISSRKENHVIDSYISRI